MRLCTTSLWLMLCLLAAGCSPVVRATPAEVILFRHAEKPLDPSDPHLSNAGRERARMLAQYLTTTPALTNRGLPNVLFATDWTKHARSRRPFDTLEPLAKRLHCKIKRPYSADDYAKLARYILTSRECDGKVFVVCWVHDNLPELVEALGVHPKPPPWKGHIYDRIWVVTWPDGQPELRELRQPPVGVGEDQTALSP